MKLGNFTRELNKIADTIADFHRSCSIASVESKGNILFVGLIIPVLLVLIHPVRAIQISNATTQQPPPLKLHEVQGLHLLT